MKKRPPESSSKEIVSALLENASRAVAKPKRVAWRLFNRFVEDADELREYVRELHDLRWNDYGTQHHKSASDIETDATYCQDLVARCKAVTLFEELERVPKRRRSAQTFKDGERELHRMLGLTSEWWTGNSVLDRSNGPCHPPGYIGHSDWYRVRRIREALLQAATT
jgi:hypothetical protein